MLCGVIATGGRAGRNPNARSDDPFLREIIIAFGAAGYVALFEIGHAHTATILAVRHQLEDDYL